MHIIGMPLRQFATKVESFFEFLIQTLSHCIVTFKVAYFALVYMILLCSGLLS